MSTIGSQPAMPVPPEILDAAMSLDHAQRAELASRLLLSLDPGEGDADPGYEDDWAEELESRFRRFVSGESTTVPTSEAVSRIREHLRRRRTP